MIIKGKEGHIPSAFSIVDVINYLYENVLNYDPAHPKWEERDYFILSKGHGCAGLYVVLHKFGLLTDEHIEQYSQQGGILGGHPDVTVVPGVEASTGSLGHGFVTGMGLALGLKIQKKPNRVFCMLGDGECNEGTIWESALVASRQKLGNLVAIVDFNGSAAQILPVDPIVDKWKAFGWKVYEMDAHDNESMKEVFGKLHFQADGTPQVIIAHSVKGKGVNFIEGHGKWHHRIPDQEEYQQILQELS